MKFKIYFIPFLILVLAASLNSCKEHAATSETSGEILKTVGVFNFDDKEQLSEYVALNLDPSHPNLLNPQIAASDHKQVIESWTDLHQRIGQHLSTNGFTWDVADSSITILQKIYFSPDGTIENYFFRVINDGVSAERKKEFAQLINQFAQHNRITFQQSTSFAQCGKTRYLNN